MMQGFLQSPPTRNEPVLDYAPGSPERDALDAELARMQAEVIEIPLVIGGEHVQSGIIGTCHPPHDHRHLLANFQQATTALVEQAIEAALAARDAWSKTPWQDRAAIFLRAADIMAGRGRARMNAAAMLDLGKTINQAEIDAVAELVDFYRFHAAYMTQIYQGQPISPPGQWNQLDWRPLEGFVFAVTPFNFASIAGNLPTAPAMMGNTVVWKPASSAVFMAWTIMSILEEAGLPPGVINFVPGPGRAVGPVALASKHLAGVHFTGSTGVLHSMWRAVSDDLHNKRTFPRIVGETGGKDFIVAHPSADVAEVVTALVRGAFEFQGQKCSAASRAYIPASLWPAVREGVQRDLAAFRQGPPTDFRNFVGAVIDDGAFKDITGFIDFAHQSEDCEVIAGGHYDDSVGWFIEPTVVLARDPHCRLMEEEIFGPVLTLYVYDDDQWAETLKLVDGTSPYALTGAVFARDRRAIQQASEALRDAAGNFYINDKPTGAVVGQQPFGGARASGTNDKAGSVLNLYRWTSPRAVKENLHPPRDWRYPFLER
ncbi:MAG: L-glutamate gamma-semialdehyde dehydrogenase [Deltaproteobacteria bacterium]|nr:L-glutamate gamma-semialdehyde dehydrogenase [Deltaproteobacteria bacterium]